MGASSDDMLRLLQGGGSGLQLTPAQQRQTQLAQALQQQALSGQPVQSPAQALGRLASAFVGRQQLDEVNQQQEQRRQRLAQTLRNVQQAGQAGVVTGPGGGGTGEVATPQQRIGDILSANPDTAQLGAQIGLSQALQGPAQTSRTISGQQANQLFGTRLSPGAAVTVEGSGSNLRISNVQEPQDVEGLDVQSTVSAVNQDTGQRETLLRTNRGLVRQQVDEQGRTRFQPVDSSRFRIVDTREVGTTQELGGLGATSKRKLRQLEASTRTFVGTTNELLGRLAETPDANTFIARASGSIEGLREEARALSRQLTGEEPKQELLNPDNFRDEFTELGITNARIQSGIQSLAFALARSREGGRLSEADIRSAIRTLGANRSDPEAFAQTLRDTAERVVRRTRNNFIAFDQEPPDTDFGLSQLPTLGRRREEQAGPTRESAQQGGQQGTIQFRLTDDGELVEVQ